MASNAVIKFLRSLHQKKFRIREECFLVEGPKMVQDLLNSRYEVQSIYATQNWDLPKSDILVPFEILTEKEMEQVSTLQTPNKVIAVVKTPVEPRISSLEPGLHLLIDQVQDPGNLGTIIRIADWFGINSVICSMDTVELYNPKVVQSTMGSLFRLPVFYQSLPDILMKNATGKKLPVYATLLQGSDLYKEKLTPDALIIMGNESRGINPLLLPFVNKGLKIPGSKGRDGGYAESLNVAVATGIVCAEFRRQFS